MELKGKVALVTGASRGIGAAIAKKLAREGANVVVNYCGSQACAMQVVKEIEQSGAQAVAIRADMTNAQEVMELIKQVEATYGAIDILVNNAGITKDNLMLKMTEAEWDAVINTNLKGTFFCVKQVVKSMIKRRSGRIINLSSVVALRGNAGQANYCASKAGIIGLTKALARELGSRGITVNAIAPGFIETDMTETLSEEMKKQIQAQIPLKRMGKPEEIAEMACFLATEKAAYITGQVLSVDGGMGI